MQVIEQGLSAGERVVVEGIQKVRSGTVVKPKGAEPAPAGAGG
jgi:membrane fusion protein (multidrug efflux system)